VRLATFRRRIPAMKTITLYKSNGDVFKSYQYVITYETTNGVLSFLWTPKPGDGHSGEKVVTSLPFFVEDDYKQTKNPGRASAGEPA
jgi:hypothetical protein